jgi:hypothetical protein
MLLYANDIVCIAKSEEDLQRIIVKVRDWCRRWQVLINTEKTKCIYFRKGRSARTDFQFRVGENVLEFIDSYKYLGVTFRSNHDFTMNAQLLAKSAGLALGKIIAKMREMKDFGCKTFEKLYKSCVVPKMDYCSGVWGFKKYQSLDNVQHRAIRHYMGVHRFAPILAIT